MCQLLLCYIYWDVFKEKCYLMFGVIHTPFYYAVFKYSLRGPVWCFYVLRFWKKNSYSALQMEKNHMHVMSEANGVVQTAALVTFRQDASCMVGYNFVPRAWIGLHCSATRRWPNRVVQCCKYVWRSFVTLMLLNALAEHSSIPMTSEEKQWLTLKQWTAFVYLGLQTPCWLNFLSVRRSL